MKKLDHSKMKWAIAKEMNEQGFNTNPSSIIVRTKASATDSSSVAIEIFAFADENQDDKTK